LRVKYASYVRFRTKHRASGGSADVERFDRRAHAYERGWRAEFHARVVAASADLTLQVAPRPAAILDVGCGTGALLRTLSSRLPGAVELAGVDPAPAMIEVARATLPHPGRRIRLERAGAERLPFADESFDLVVSTVSFHHWEDQAAGLAEVARVLSGGGRLVLVDHFAVGWLRVWNALARRGMRSRGEVEAMLRRAGLAPTLRTRVFDLGPLPLIRAIVAHKDR
jgi:ubiquinone/menaquinone biosynthesis C-methylase UbiE